MFVVVGIVEGRENTGFIQQRVKYEPRVNFNYFLVASGNIQTSFRKLLNVSVQQTFDSSTLSGLEVC